MSECYTVCDNGGWCWYQDPRVIADHETGKLLLTTISSRHGLNGRSRNGDAQITTFDPATGEATTLAIGRKLTTGGSGDDHNVPALWQRPDGRYLVMHTGHNYGIREKRPQSFYRISTNPNDATTWDDERLFNWPTFDPVGTDFIAVTYSNLHHLADEGGEKGVLYNIARAAGQTWQIATSEDWGETWAYRGILTLPPEGGRAYSNGYPKFCSNGKDRIDFIITEAHPRDYNNGVYHGYIQNGKTHDAAGNVLDENTFSDQAPLPEKFTTVFEPAEQTGDNRHTGWTTALTRDENDELHALFTTRVGTDNVRPADQTTNNIGDAQHAIFYAKLVGDQWQTVELGLMDKGLYLHEEDYTGLGAIDPRDGKTLYISTTYDPTNGQRYAAHEIFKGVTDDGGKTWQWTAVTKDSYLDNLRPVATKLPDGRVAVSWLYGTYKTMHEYSLSVQVCIDP